MLGWLTKEKDKNVLIKANIPSEDRSNYSQVRYKFFLEAPFEISNQCCNIMKKNPAHKYHKDTGRCPITAQMANESRLRKQKWLANGCNGFDLKIPTSNPMSFWTEQDVLEYIYINDLPICSVYGKVVKADDGQYSLFEEKPTYRTTGCNRTGCMLCGFGCHLEKDEDNRFLRLQKTHPKMYDLLDVVKNNGYTFRQAVEWINKNGNMNIKIGDKNTNEK